MSTFSETLLKVCLSRIEKKAQNYPLKHDQRVKFMSMDLGCTVGEFERFLEQKGFVANFTVKHGKKVILDYIGTFANYPSSFIRYSATPDSNKVYSVEVIINQTPELLLDIFKRKYNLELQSPNVYVCTVGKGRIELNIAPDSATVLYEDPSIIEEELLKQRLERINQVDLDDI